jgi:hypothetical protein
MPAAARTASILPSVALRFSRMVVSVSDACSLAELRRALGAVGLKSSAAWVALPLVISPPRSARATRSTPDLRETMLLLPLSFPHIVHSIPVPKSSAGPACP